MFYIKNIFNEYYNTLSRWKDYKSRSPRRECWIFNCINIVCYFVLLQLRDTITQQNVFNIFMGITYIYVLFILIPSIPLVIRRLHHLGFSGKWYFLYLFAYIVDDFFLDDGIYEDLFS
ncbi:DUF805 domain-containing protein [Commensalibacter papalotli (ex Botero et al. 2024)]|uniref:DUF805 family (YhaH) n=1 Tax=Commensalibacter papalotli (ex Botero et al. 2024) TaxID=2972766 RepID=A0ABM9HHQ1_9PROT|nr:DUF805 family (yhaH) [Commensalibacter papalotli (ex Botero et al. 2024)]